MYKAIIVDDEIETSQILRELIDWDSLGFEVVDVCSDGISAYSSIMLHRPQIVLTDIMMPGLTGIELVSRVHATSLNVRFIIISAYGEFEYAREAMQYGVKHYLLKPCNEEQITEAINELYADLLQEKLARNKSGASARKKHELNYFSPQIESVLRIIEENISNPQLSLKWIAENHVYSNVDYLSRKFQSETGHKFKEYLTSLRISKAKEIMITRQNESVFAIADEVGFLGNPQYFSQVFKKSTGITPSEYMKNLTCKTK